MRTLHYFVLFLALGFFGGNLFASETADLFKDRLPKMSSENQDERKNAQQDWMRYCLQNGNKSEIREEACNLMLEQLGNDTPVETKVWLIRQLGYIGDDAAVSGLKKVLSSDEKRVADEAARALANIPGDAAAAALKEVGTELAKAALHEAGLDRDVLRKNENETAMPMAIPYVSEEKVAEWMKGYASMDDLEKMQTLANIAVRRDARYIKEAIEGMKSDNAFLRDVAIITVGTIGSSREIPSLLEQVFEGKNKELAKQSLVRMNDRMLDARLLGTLEAEKDNGRFEQIADILNKRENAAAMPIILARAKTPNCPNRLELLQIAEGLASKDEIGGFIEVWAGITNRGQKDRAEQIIARLVDGDSKPVTAKRTTANYADMFSLLGRIGDDASLEEIRNRVFGKPLPSSMTATPELKAAALRAMCNWPNARVANDLLQVVEGTGFANPEKIAALRGYIRVASLPNDRIGINVREKGKVEMLEKAMKLSTRVDEKRLAIQRAGQVRHVDSLNFIMRHFDTADLQSDACNSVVELAHHTELRNSAKTEFGAALDKVLKTSKDQNLLDRAKRYRDAM